MGMRCWQSQYAPAGNWECWHLWRGINEKLLGGSVGGVFRLFRKSRAGKCIHHNSPGLLGKSLEAARLFQAPRG